MALISMFLVETCPVFAMSSSDNYNIYNGQFTSAVNKSSSDNFNVSGSLNALVGEGESTNYQVLEDIKTNIGNNTGTSLSSSGVVATNQDTLPPRLSSLYIVGVTYNQVQILFTTDELAVSYIDYVATGQMLSTGQENSFSTEHSFYMANLSSNTAYSFSIHLMDTNRNVVKTENYSFRTLPLLKYIPNVNNIKISQINSAAVLTWQNPDWSQLQQLAIIRNDNHYPQNIADGQLVFQGLASNFSDNSVLANKSYYYSVYVINKDNEYSSGALAHVTIVEKKSSEESQPEKPIVPALPEIPTAPEKTGAIEEVEPTDIVPPVIPNSQAFEEIIPAETFPMPRFVEPLRPVEKSAIKENLITLYTLIKQKTAKSYQEFVNFVVSLGPEAWKQLNNIREGLVDEYGQLRSDVYESLDNNQKEQVKKIVNKPLPPLIAKKESPIINFLSNLSKGLKEKISTIKNGLYDQYGQVQEEVAKLLTSKEKEQIEQAIEQPLPKEKQKESFLSDFFNNAKNKISSISNKLSEQIGDIRDRAWKLLQPQDKQQEEKFVEPDHPGTESVVSIKLIEFFNGLSNNVKEKVAAVRGDLFDKMGRIKEETLKILTPEEKRQVEEIVMQPIPAEEPKEAPPVFEASDVTEVVPFSLKTQEYGANWDIIAGEEALLSIPKKVFSKEVQVIIVTVKNAAYILKYNAENDGYETIIKAPDQKGKYQMLIQVIYQDNTFEELNKTILVDPYGYVYEKKFNSWSWKKPWQIFTRYDKQVRSAFVTIYTQNKVGEWVEWPAHLYNQFNPQSTGEDGSFVFLVPPGQYYLQVVASGYESKKTDIFEVESRVLNQNVELKANCGQIWVIIKICGIILALIFIAIFGYIIIKRHKKS